MRMPRPTNGLVSLNAWSTAGELGGVAFLEELFQKPTPFPLALTAPTTCGSTCNFSVTPLGPCLPACCFAAHRDSHGPRTPKCNAFFSKLPRSPCFVTVREMWSRQFCQNARGTCSYNQVIPLSQKASKTNSSNN